MIKWELEIDHLIPEIETSKRKRIVKKPFDWEEQVITVRAPMVKKSSVKPVTEDDAVEKTERAKLKALKAPQKKAMKSKQTKKDDDDDFQLKKSIRKPTAAYKRKKSLKKNTKAVAALAKKESKTFLEMSKSVTTLVTPAINKNYSFEHLVAFASMQYELIMQTEALEAQAAASTLMNLAQTPTFFVVEANAPAPAVYKSTLDDLADVASIEFDQLIKSKQIAPRKLSMFNAKPTGKLGKKYKDKKGAVAKTKNFDENIMSNPLIMAMFRKLSTIAKPVALCHTN